MIRLSLALWLMLGALGAAAEPPDRAAIEEIVREYILANPEIIAQALEKQAAIEAEARAKAQAQAARALVTELRDDAMIPRIGPDDASVVMVEFFDYNCGYCRRVAEDVFALAEKDDDLQILLVELPILGEPSVDAARVALAAAAQGQYWPFHQALLRAEGRITAEMALAQADTLGLDREKVMEAMASEAVTASLRANIERARKVQVTGTPAFIIGERVIPGAAPLAQLEAAIAAARES